MTTQPEARISQAILKALKVAGVFAFKVHGGPNQMAGLPDILTCVEGRFVGLEVKTPHKRSNVSERQKYVRDLIIASGGTSVVVCSVPEAMAVINELRLAMRKARKL